MKNGQFLSPGSPYRGPGRPLLAAVLAAILCIGSFAPQVRAQTNRINVNSQVQAKPLTDTGAANAYAVSLSAMGAAYYTGMPVVFTAAHANTSASTINVNSLGTKTIKKLGGTADLASGDIQASQIVVLIYDGTFFQIQSPLGNSTSGSVPCGQMPALTGDVTTSAGSCATTVALVAGTAAATVKTRDFGTTFGDTGGSALTSGSVVYFTVPYACTIAAWNISVDAGTATLDIWKIATGTAIPTVTNTITASALPAISTGTSIHSTTLTAWTTSVSANDIFGIQLKTVATAKFVELDIQCGQ